MKTHHGAALSLFLLALPLVAQTYEARIDQWLSNNTLVVDLLFNTVDGMPDHLGDATLVLDYNDAALAFIGQDTRYDGLWDSNYSPSYLPMVAQDYPPRIVIHIVRTDQGIGVPVPFAPTRVIRLLFRVLDTTALSGIAWDRSQLTRIADWLGNFIDYKFIFLQPPPFTVPIELSGFSAEIGRDGVHLCWITESETENLGFMLQRAVGDESHFSLLNEALIPGAGNSQSRQSYRFVDTAIEPGEIYRYQLISVDFQGNQGKHEPICLQVMPTTPVLSPNFPNPFNPETTFSFSLPKDDQIEISIYNTLGQAIRVLVNAPMQAGVHRVVWNGLEDSGEQAASGVYHAVLTTSSHHLVQRIVLLR
ncbi:T9SS type A sorting domain-containing protein [candidate division KSB1 bacterium]|nr:T9SS type A sorting domain-containing protein [candidate division KSB1 bacterium]